MSIYRNLDVIYTIPYSWASWNIQDSWITSSNINFLAENLFFDKGSKFFNNVDMIGFIILSKQKIYKAKYILYYSKIFWIPKLEDYEIFFKISVKVISIFQ